MLKESLTQSPVLRQPDPNKPWRIETDASEWATGAALYQEDEEGHWHPIAFSGRKLQGAELNYPVHEKECLAIKDAIRNWSNYLGTQHVQVLTDHESLKYLKTMQNPSKRLARWLEEFQEYNLDIQYRKGAEAIVPDAISRRPDLMGKGPANRAFISLMKTQEEFVQAMILMKSKGVLPVRP